MLLTIVVQSHLLSVSRNLIHNAPWHYRRIQQVINLIKLNNSVTQTNIIVATKFCVKLETLAILLLQHNSRDSCYSALHNIMK